MAGIFERAALIATGGLAAAAIIATVVAPPERTTASPKARLAAAADSPASVSVAGSGVTAFIPAKARGSETLLGAREIRSLDRTHVAKTLESAKSLDRTFESLGYDLDRVSAGDAEVPRVYLASLPLDIGEIRETKRRKALFFKSVLPLVLRVNEEILEDRRRLWELRSRLKMGEKLGPIDRLWLIVLAERYKIKRGDLDSLVARVDIIPPSLALAQAAEESGWGTSRFAREGNAVFGEWTFDKGMGLVPREREAGKTHRIRIFESLLHSVRAYARNLNTYRAYRKLRAARAELRRDGRPVDGMRLANELKSYSERGEVYIKTLRSIMTVNKLRPLDGARLSDDFDPAPFI